MYVKTLALKYPMMAGKVKGMKTLDKLVLMKNLRPIFIDNDKSSSRMQDSGRGRPGDQMPGEVRMRSNREDDYMGDPIAKEVLRFYEDRDPFFQPGEMREQPSSFNHLPGRLLDRRSLESYAHQKYQVSQD